MGKNLYVDENRVREAVEKCTKTLFKGQRNWKKLLSSGFEFKLEKAIIELFESEKNVEYKGQ